MVQQGRHACHLPPGGFAAFTRQPVESSSLVIGGGPVPEFFDQIVLEHLLN